MEENLNSFINAVRNFSMGLSVDAPQNENVLYLAFIGDAIFDLFTRDYLLRKNITKIKMDNMHKSNTDLVCAKSQASIVERLIDDSVLNDKEIDFYRHARNAHPHSKSKNSSIVDYRKATGFEALLGLLYFNNDIDELKLIFAKIKEYLDAKG